MRMLRVMGHAFGGDPSLLADALSKERGDIATTNDPATGFDRSGINKLKAMIGRGRK